MSAIAVNTNSKAVTLSRDNVIDQLVTGRSVRLTIKPDGKPVVLLPLAFLLVKADKHGDLVLDDETKARLTAVVQTGQAESDIPLEFQLDTASQACDELAAIIALSLFGLGDAVAYVNAA